MEGKTAADLWAAIADNKYAKRAVEVALVGDHSILFYGPTGVGKSMFCSVLDELGHKKHAEIRLCPCGHLGDETAVCTCTAEQLARFITQATYRKTLEQADIAIGVIYSKNLGWNSQYQEGLEAVLERVKVAQGNIRPEELSPDATRLIGMSYSKLCLTLAQRTKVVSVAGTIARMEGTQWIRPAHVAEAVQYRVPQALEI